MRFIGTVLAAAVVIVLVYVAVAIVADGYFGANIFPDRLEPGPSPPNTWADWRDVMFILVSVLWIIATLILIAILVALLLLVRALRNLLRDNVAPAVDSARDVLDNLRGTAEFTGETVVSPIIRTYAVVRGVRSGISAITNLPGRIGGRKKKKGRR
jgi:ABC-type phosphate/phosphonate transport system permease subunit